MTKCSIYRAPEGGWRLIVPDTMPVSGWWWPYSDYQTFAGAIAALDLALAQARAVFFVRAAPRLLPVDRLFTEGR